MKQFFQYDAFISYSHDDKDWVRGWFLPRLAQASLQICVDFNSFKPGVPNLINIEHAIERSRKTIIVLTPGWVESQWTAFEGLLLQSDDLLGAQQRMIPILLASCNLPRRIAILTYLDFTIEIEREIQLQRLIELIGPTPEALRSIEPAFAETQLYTQARALIMQQQWDAALAVLDTLRNADPDYPGLAEMLSVVHDARERKIHADLVAEVDLLVRVGKWDAARTRLDEAIKLTDASPELLTLREIALRAQQIQVLIRAERWNDALPLVSKLIMDVPENPIIAEFYTTTKRGQRAVELEALYSKGLGAFKSQAWSEALYYFEQVLAREPGYRQVERHLITIKQKLTELDAA